MTTPTTTPARFPAEYGQTSATMAQLLAWTRWPSGSRRRPTTGLRRRRTRAGPICGRSTVSSSRTRSPSVAHRRHGGCVICSDAKTSQPASPTMMSRPSSKDRLSWSPTPICRSHVPWRRRTEPSTRSTTAANHHRIPHRSGRCGHDGCTPGRSATSPIVRLDSTSRRRPRIGDRACPSCCDAPSAPDVDEVAAVWYAGWRESHLGNVPDALLAHRSPERFRACVRS